MNAREAALKTLTALRSGKGKLDDLLREQCRDLDARDSALARTLAYGVVRRQDWLDAGLKAFVRTGDLPPWLLDALRIGAFQCWFLDRVPRRAVVNETVEMAKRRAPWAAGLCNAVLRRLPDAPQEDVDGACRHSVPEWLYHRVEALLGAEAEAFWTASDEPASLVVHRNIMRPDIPLPDGLEAVPGVPDCYVAGSLDMDWLERGGGLVADTAAKLCVMAGMPRPGERVWDCCAAPGGKAALMAMMMAGRGVVLATDISEERLKKVRQTAARLALPNVRRGQGDAVRYTPDGLYDLVLCDAPCSGYGVLRRKPDIRRRSREEAEALPGLQASILENVSRAVKPGGRLVYCTCTVLPEENGDVVRRFLVNHGDFYLEGFSLPVGDASGGEIQLWPHIQGTDGFYMVRLRRLGSDT